MTPREPSDEMNFLGFVRERWLTIYPVAVLAAFGLGFLLKDQAPGGYSFYPAVLLTMPWSAFPNNVMPGPVNAFLDAFYSLPFILVSMTLNIAFIGCIQWVVSRLPSG
jgi:hypothetical protein